MIKLARSLLSAREARRQHKAWGGAERNPRVSEAQNAKPTKWATALRYQVNRPFLRCRTFRALVFLPDQLDQRLLKYPIEPRSACGLYCELLRGVGGLPARSEFGRIKVSE
jgi:hypothetical protein